MVIKPIQIFKSTCIIFITNKQFQGVHHHIIGRVALERFAAMVIFLTVVCKVYAKENKGGGGGSKDIIRCLPTVKILI